MQWCVDSCAPGLGTAGGSGESRADEPHQASYNNSKGDKDSGLQHDQAVIFRLQLDGAGSWGPWFASTGRSGLGTQVQRVSDSNVALLWLCWKMWLVYFNHVLLSSNFPRLEASDSPVGSI
jgi:hypothetical protein